MSIGPVNDSSTPAEFPNNEWTQMIEAVRARNLRGAPMPPEEGVPSTGTPMPAVRSAELGRPVAKPAEDPNRPLTPEEIETLNQEALKSGLIVGPVNPSIARTLDSSGLTIDGEPVQYGSLEEAIAAGAPVGADEAAVAEGAMRFREAMPTSPTVPVRSPRMVVGAQGRMTAREFIAAQPALPRLPDFKKVQMIDMVNGKVYVDGLEFSLEPTEAKMLRKFCVTKAKEQIEKALAAALKELAEGDDGGTEAV